MQTGRRLQRKGAVKLATELSDYVMEMEACYGAHHLDRRLRDQGH
jgi:transposase